MRRRGVVDRCGDPSSDVRNHFEALRNHRLGYGQLVSRLTGAHVVQPDDLTVAVIELRATVIVRSGLMRLEMPVRDRVGVVGV